MNTETALEPLNAARRALAEATTLPEMQDIHAAAAALRKYALARGLGIEAENSCAEIVYRAERKMGAELLRMRASGEISKQGEAKSNPSWMSPHQTSSLADLGLHRDETRSWQDLARIPDEDWDALLAERLTLPDARLSRDNLIRAYFGPPQKKIDPLRIDIDDWTTPWKAIVTASATLGTALDSGWPLQSDRTHRGWAEVYDQINAVGRNLLLFQKRVGAHLAALAVSATADTEGPEDDD